MTRQVLGPTRLARLALLPVILLLALAAWTAPARAGMANAGIPGAPSSDPLAGLPWGNYTGPQDEVFPAYERSSGRTRRLLGLIALRPRMRWFGSWYPDDQARATARDYIAGVTGGRSDVLSQMAVFRVDPWEGAACHALPTQAQQASYRSWIDAFAAGIGSARVALVLQPDLPFALCAPRHSHLTMLMVAYAARVLDALPHTTVYLDAGAADWESVGQATALLAGSGVRYARGFALDDTHYDSTQSEIYFGQRIVQALARRGIPGLHFVVNTASNGHPFTFQQYHGPDFDNAAVCRSRHSVRCASLGIPPTTDVTDPRWGLSRRARAVAGRLVDAYLWIGRPWLYNQSDPFVLSRSLALAASTPF